MYIWFSDPEHWQFKPGTPFDIPTFMANKTSLDKIWSRDACLPL